MAVMDSCVRFDHRPRSSSKRRQLYRSGYSVDIVGCSSDQKTPKDRPHSDLFTGQSPMLDPEAPRHVVQAGDRRARPWIYFV